MKKFLRAKFIGTPAFKNVILGIIVSVLFLNTKVSYGQATNSGTDFWFGFPEVYDSTTASFVVYISSLVSSSGTISVPGQGFSQNFSVIPGNIARIVLPAASVEVTTSEVLENKAIHVTSTNDVVVYAHTYHQYRADASLILPVPALGSEYYVASYNPSGTAPSEFLIIGSGTTTTVEITPSANTEGGKVANVPFNVTLNSGQVYQIQSTAGDLTGSRVRGLNATDKFSVIGGSKFPAVPFTGGGTKDPLYEQLFPVSSWGKNYVFIPTPLLNDDICRVISSQNGTSISMNGTPVATLNAGQFYEQSITTPSFISANQPISVARYLKCATCVANPVQSPSSNQRMSDPAMLIINANEQMFLDTITFYAAFGYKIDTNYLQVVTRTPDVNTIFLDGVNVGSKFSTVASNPLYSFMNTPVDTGAHTLKSNGCGFLAYITGLGGAESYAYAAGVALQNFAAVIPDSTCRASAVPFSATSIGSSVAWNWNFGDGNTDTLQNPSHAYAAAGTYTVKLIVTLNSGCTDTISKSITVHSCSLVPQVIFTSSDTIFCDEGGKCIDFFDHSTNNPTSWKWSFPGGQPDTSTAQNPTGICYYTTGSYQVTFEATNSNGSDSLIVNPLIIFVTGANLPTITRSDDTLFCSHASSYQWYFNGLPIPGATDSFYVATQDGTYNIYITDDNGCSRLGNSVSVLFTGVINPGDKWPFEIYPNPSSGSFMISFKQELADVSVEIINSLGQQIYFEKILKYNTYIDLKAAQGMYFAKINYRDNQYILKLVIQ